MFQEDTKKKLLNAVVNHKSVAKREANIIWLVVSMSSTK